MKKSDGAKFKQLKCYKCFEKYLLKLIDSMARVLDRNSDPFGRE